MKKLIFLSLLPLSQVFGYETHELIMGLRVKARENYFLMKNSDDQCQKSYFEGKFVAYREAISIIESQDSED